MIYDLKLFSFKRMSKYSYKKKQLQVDKVEKNALKINRAWKILWELRKVKEKTFLHTSTAKSF